MQLKPLDIKHTQIHTQHNEREEDKTGVQTTPHVFSFWGGGSQGNVLLNISSRVTQTQKDMRVIGPHVILG